ncbi:hypothetical protein FRZ67_04820 [Panacibacter ginsenosidivorans]|uniref:Uncharacterized protein n=1 Tax=Panacibacter ginsenosidivorans TaxID=1813871 RepID=A0A5B8V5I9_9BACT|nr:hypothetical protein [Panacibacter ginsenosidivorans]QEC66654.1 hypothetical protein FRZ67_04820 [Panacibacter ginsenosidivorans]
MSQTATHHEAFLASHSSKISYILNTLICTLTNIVVTDGYTLNPGDLSWESITTLSANYIILFIKKYL